MNIGMYRLWTKKRLTAKRTVVPVNFRCAAPRAKAVSVVGDFNDWRPHTHPMRRHVDGSWLLQIALKHGHHHYRFLVDGKPVLDPHAHGVVRNERGEEVSLICVS